MSRQIHRHITNNLIGYVALFFSLTLGTAQALSGSNTVFSDDIVDGEVRSADIANGRIFNVDLADNVITGQKMKDDTLTGADIDESTLDATSYFAYVRDFGDDDTATMPVAEGIRSVVDPRNGHSYEVIFERSMDFCAVQVTPGLGPSSPGGAFAPTSIPRLDYTDGPADTVGVKFHDARAPTELVDTAFIISATC